MEKRYMLSLEYESDIEWGVGCSGHGDDGEMATGPEIAKILRKVATLLEENFPGEVAGVVYPPHGGSA